METIQQTGNKSKEKKKGDKPSKLSFRKVPFVLLTNGGGMTEEEKANQISEIVGVKVCVCLSPEFFHHQTRVCVCV